MMNLIFVALIVAIYAATHLLVVGLAKLGKINDPAWSARVRCRRANTPWLTSRSGAH